MTETEISGKQWLYFIGFEPDKVLKAKGNLPVLWKFGSGLKSKVDAHISSKSIILLSFIVSLRRNTTGKILEKIVLFIGVTY